MMFLEPVNARPSQRGGIMLQVALVVSAAGIVMTLTLQTKMISEALQTKIDENLEAKDAARNQYYLGLYCYYLMNTMHSRVMFQRVIDKFPTSEYVGKSMFKMAQTFERKGIGLYAMVWYKKALQVMDEDDPLRSEAQTKVRQYTRI